MAHLDGRWVDEDLDELEVLADPRPLRHVPQEQCARLGIGYRFRSEVVGVFRF